MRDINEGEDLLDDDGGDVTDSVLVYVTLYTTNDDVKSSTQVDLGQNIMSPGSFFQVQLHISILPLINKQMSNGRVNNSMCIKHILFESPPPSERKYAVVRSAVPKGLSRKMIHPQICALAEAIPPHSSHWIGLGNWPPSRCGLCGSFKSVRGADKHCYWWAILSTRRTPKKWNSGKTSDMMESVGG